MINQYELITTSFHEAGHTLCGLLFHMKIPSVGIKIYKNDVSGYTHYNSIDNSRAKNNYILNRLLISEIYVCYAGMAAEKILYKDILGCDNLPQQLKNGSSSDIFDVSEIIKKNNLAPAGKKRTRFKKKLFNKTINILKYNWDDLKLIAHAISKNKKLYYDDIKFLLLKNSINKKFWKRQFQDIDFWGSSETPIDNFEIKYILRSQ